MKKYVLAVLILFSAVVAIAPPAEARVRVDVGIGCCGYGYYPPGWGYYGYPSYYYVAPPPVVYVPPPVAYAQPAPTYYAAPPAGYAPAGMPANQASPTYVDQNTGQTCREYQSSATIAGAPQQAYGTACLQPDGTWRVVK